ncbi:MAG: UTP--glucose-1-phosphate uridylyltransferase GalU [Rhodospirillales bacterium]|nr:UTP--glucose-1-phosphate uridylyltransferase GalU [Alphaproteobacteria bacterium]USO02906.1 MAG: UTP--glucose-1-phosphate uridylyltransferase GalU [Rhodospirillales bacterium]
MTDQKDYKPVRKAVFPVAGLGTRFLPATKAMPKEMLPINDRPLIQHVLEEARHAGIEEFIFVTGRHKRMLEEHFDYQPELMETLESRGKEDMLEQIKSCEMPAGKLFLTRQPRPLGLGHAVWCAKKLVADEPFAVLLPDDIIKHPDGCLKQMMETYAEKGGNVIAVKEVPRAETKNYGIVETGTDNGRDVSVKGLVEKPAPDKAPSTLSVIGRYILQPEVFEHLDGFETGAGGEIQLTDALATLIGRQPFHGLRFEGDHYDCGSRIGFIEANIAFALSDPEIGDNVRSILEKFTQQKEFSNEPAAAAG